MKLYLFVLSIICSLSLSITGQSGLPDGVRLLEKFDHLNSSTSKIELLSYSQDSSSAFLVIDGKSIYNVTDDPIETVLISDQNDVIRKPEVVNAEHDEGLYFFSITHQDSYSATLKYIDKNDTVRELVVLEDYRFDSESVLIIPNSTSIYFTVQPRNGGGLHLFTMERDNPSSLEKIDLELYQYSFAPDFFWINNGFYYLKTEDDRISLEFFNHETKQSHTVYDYKTESGARVYYFGGKLFTSDVDAGRMEIISIDLNSEQINNLGFIEGVAEYALILEAKEFGSKFFFTTQNTTVGYDLWVYDNLNSELRVVEDNSTFPANAFVRNITFLDRYIYWTSSQFGKVQLFFMDTLTNQVINVINSDGTNKFDNVSNLIPFGGGLYFINEEDRDKYLFYIPDPGGPIEKISSINVNRILTLNNKLYFVENNVLKELAEDGNRKEIGGDRLPLYALENIYAHHNSENDGRELIVYDNDLDSAYLFYNFSTEPRPSEVVWHSNKNSTIGVYESVENGFEPFHFNHEDQTVQLVGNYDLSTNHDFHFIGLDSSILMNLVADSGNRYVGSFNTSNGFSMFLDENTLNGEFFEPLQIYEHDLYYTLSTELWKYSSTDGHVFLMEDDLWGNPLQRIDPVYFNDKIWIKGDKGIYSTDGSSQGTVFEFGTDSESECVGDIYEAAGQLLFTLPGGIQNDLWTYDTLSSKFVLLHELNMTNGAECTFEGYKINDNLLFPIGDSLGGSGTMYSRIPSGELEVIFPFWKKRKGENEVYLNDEIYFNSFNLFRTGGTSQSTSAIFPSKVTDLQSNEKSVFFIHEEKIYRYDPESEEISQLFEEEVLFNIRDLHVHKSKLFFQARTSITGPYKMFLYEISSKINVTGIVYHDENNDKIYNEEEKGIQSVPVKVNNLTIFSGRDGSFSFYVEDVDDIDLTIEEVSCWIFDGSNYIINKEGDGTWNLQIGLTEGGEMGELESFINIGRPRCGFTVPLSLDIINNICDTVAGKVGVVLDTLLALEGTFDEVEIINDTIWWNIDLLKSDWSHHQILVTVADENFNGEAFSVSTFFKDKNSGVVTKFPKLEGRITCAIDPNDKLVSPDREDPGKSNYTLKGEYIYYTIRFQNTGTDTAFTVTIRDQLSDKLDWSSLRPLSSSHDVITELSESGEITFTFTEILLPDDKTNEPASHGYVSYRIETKSEIQDFEVIENYARIYFDFNQPIITNTVSSTMVTTIDFDNDSFPFWEDCDDMNSLINPNSSEIANNSIDENCDGEILIIDDDMDGFNSDEDCNDTDATINPASEDIANNGIDEDCNGEDLINTSVADFDDSYLKIYPNPASSTIRVETLENKRYQFFLLNIFGQEISSGFYKGEEIDISMYSVGTYFLKIRQVDTQDFTVTKLIIIR